MKKNKRTDGKFGRTSERMEECESDLTSLLMVGGCYINKYNTVIGKTSMTEIVIVLVGLYCIDCSGFIAFVCLLWFPIDLKIQNAPLDTFLFHLHCCH